MYSWSLTRSLFVAIIKDMILIAIVVVVVVGSAIAVYFTSR